VLERLNKVGNERSEYAVLRAKTEPVGTRVVFVRSRRADLMT
jgi:hypothetical protein